MQLKPIEESGFPLAVKRLLNKVVEWVTRPMVVKFEETSVPRFESSDLKLMLVLPLAFQIATAASRPFQAVIITSTGTMRFKVLAGKLNAQTISEQIFTVSATGKVWAHIHDDGGYFEDTWELQNGASVPAQTEHDGYYDFVDYTVTAGVLTVKNTSYGPISHRNATGGEHEWQGVSYP